MILSDDAAYNAVLSHDRRFDGVFFTAVRSTGIYCRPICTAPAPGRKQCTFYASAAQAEAAGYRPCLRCRPERAPQSRDTNSQPLNDALRLAAHIDQTLLADETLQGAMERYATSERHIRRLFHDHFGTDPKQYVTTRRLLFAKQLLQDTRLPVVRVAYAAGFGSESSMTKQMKQAYGFTPRRFREHPSAPESPLCLHVDYRPPFAWKAILTFLGGRAVPQERVENDAYYRSYEGFEVCVHNDAAKNSVVVTIPIELAPRAHEIIQKVRKVFDLDANPSAIAAALSGDAIIGRLVAQEPGLRVPGCWDDFEMTMRVIIGQQISVAGATTIMRRLCEKTPITPRAIAALSINDIAALGMPGKRAHTIQMVAQHVTNGIIDLEEHDPTRLRDALLAIPGIGPWTTEYLMMRTRHWPDAFPASDLALQKAVIPGQRLTEKQLTSYAEQWRPWRAYATMHLWRSLHNNGG